MVTLTRSTTPPLARRNGRNRPLLGHVRHALAVALSHPRQLTGNPKQVQQHRARKAGPGQPRAGTSGSGLMTVGGDQVLQKQLLAGAEDGIGGHGPAP